MYIHTVVPEVTVLGGFSQFQVWEGRAVEPCRRSSHRHPACTALRYHSLLKLLVPTLYTHKFYKFNTWSELHLVPQAGSQNLRSSQTQDSPTCPFFPVLRSFPCGGSSSTSQEGGSERDLGVLLINQPRNQFMYSTLPAVQVLAPIPVPPYSVPARGGARPRLGAPDRQPAQSSRCSRAVRRHLPRQK